MIDDSPMNPATKSPYGGLILDGVTGSGKSTILGLLPGVLRTPPAWECNGIFTEEQTCGEFWDELRDNPGSSDEYKTRMLANVVERVEQARISDPNYHFVLERAQYSLYAALPEWRLYEAFDERLARLNPVAILLDLSDEALAKRSVIRNDRPWVRDYFINLYGSKSKAVEELRATQNRRKEALTLSKIPYHIIDVSNGAWNIYAAEIKVIVGKQLS